MLRGLFVTGTDTNAGKTVTCAALVHRYRPSLRLRYWKPVQTGIEQDDDTAEVRRLAACGEEEILPQGVRLQHPVSPHLAAKRSGQTIAIDQLTGLIQAQPDGTAWIVEGAGGVLVPLNGNQLMIDLICALELPVLVVARSALGTINHTLLTLQALRGRSICIAGVVMVGDRNPDNRAAIEEYGHVAVLGEMPVFQRLESEDLRLWAAAELDPQSRLLDLLQ